MTHHPDPSRRRLLAAGALAAAAPGVRAAAHWQPATLPQSRQRDIVASANGQRYRIFVSVPERPAPPAGHPVLYALDGNATFASLALMARTAGARAAVTGRVPPLVVGIGYPTERDYDPARGRDYTPPAGQDAVTGEGGANRFLDVIERDVMPLVRGLAPVDPARQALFGHSYGGLCVLHALFSRPALFQTYLASSPSIWYGNRAVLGGVAGLGQRTSGLARKPALLLSVGELERAPARPGGAGSANPAAAQRRMVEEASELAARLQGMPEALSVVRFHLLPGESHGSAVFAAMARGMEFFVT
ncbi:alpha/beta hydrolase [Massilia sp. YMA4]|uniref:alpha/beta hydrolase n=1 Tax=Massilia sp. YMA4 TaxID=1593482 RepID=UPI000DD0FBBA|nr:alpha/beta hydrolase-fold protein [Massilia sp. YMA4]AXA90937.1 alpha/beta hydrolase [Massilia sp. YMA4]